MLSYVFLPVTAVQIHGRLLDTSRAYPQTGDRQYDTFNSSGRPIVASQIHHRNGLAIQ